MENVFEEKGIQFKVITEKMIPEVSDFLWIHFFPDEPICRSLGVTRNWFTDTYLKDAMKDGSSMVAMDREGNIVGARLGLRRRRSEWGTWLVEKLMSMLPTRLWVMILPKELSQEIPIIEKLFPLLEYDLWNMLDKLDCETIYEDRALCTARTSRVKGLGTELCRRTEILAEELGCTHTYALVTGLLYADV